MSVAPLFIFYINVLFTLASLKELIFAGRSSRTDFHRSL